MAIEREELMPNGSLFTTHHYRVRDAAGRAVEETLPDGTVRAMTFDEAGRLLTAEKGTGVERTTYQYDGRGLLLREGRPALSSSTLYGFDAGGRPLVKRVAKDAGPEITSLSYDSVKRLKTRQRPGSGVERFEYAGDGMLTRHVTRLTGDAGTPPLAVTYRYDGANRLVETVPEPGFVPPPGSSYVDGGDVTTYDRASRVLTTDMRWGSGAPREDAGVAFSNFDLRGLPARETTGLLQRLAPSPPQGALERSYDVYGNTKTLTLPAGTAVAPGSFTGVTRAYDMLDRLTSAQPTGPPGVPIPAMGAVYAWGGDGRLVSSGTMGVLPLSQNATFDPLNGRLTGLSSTVGGTPTGALSVTWEPASDRKTSRTAQLGAGSSGTATQGAGATFSHDAFNSLQATALGSGNAALPAMQTTTLQYGRADELRGLTHSARGATSCESGAEGRPTTCQTPTGLVTFAYDGEGRRIEDAGFRFTWDWRGRLTRAEQKGAPGDLVLYAYDANGRLLTREHRGPLPQGVTNDDLRPVREKRLFVWEGASLRAEMGLGPNDAPLWRKQYVDGPGGLDDHPQVRVESELQTATPVVKTYNLQRDEMGSVAAIYEDRSTVSGIAPPLLGRYFYDAYGAAFAELGPELLRVQFDSARTTVNGTAQAAPLTGQWPGGLSIQTTSPLALASLAAGLELEVDDNGTWIQVPAADLLVGRDTADATTLLVVRRNCWPADKGYRITLTSAIADDFGRLLRPPGGTPYRLHVPIPPTVQGPPNLDVRYPMTLNAATAAADTLGGAFPGGQSHLFQGLWYDAVTGLGYARNRWLDSSIGVFLSPDPIGSVDSENLYLAVVARPHRVVDPLGLRGLPAPATPATPVTEVLRDGVRVLSRGEVRASLTLLAGGGGGAAANTGGVILRRAAVPVTAALALGLSGGAWISLKGDLVEANADAYLAEANADYQNSVLRRRLAAYGAPAGPYADPDSPYWVQLQQLAPSDPAYLSLLIQNMHWIEEREIARKKGTKGRGASSDRLAANLVQAGVARPDGVDAHHIVAGTSPKAEEARAQLERFDIEINDAVNGVFLPSAFHDRMHTDEYFDDVNRRLRRANDRNDAIEILESIRQRLQKQAGL
ncbi:MAG: AHH domain-containing protein [Acidobacteria bacterium]|nr:AHH domain-containing protein [Acidobacteriota bacterium]